MLDCLKTMITSGFWDFSLRTVECEECGRWKVKWGIDSADRPSRWGE